MQKRPRKSSRTVDKAARMASEQSGMQAASMAIIRLESERRRSYLREPAWYCKKYLNKRAKSDPLISKILERLRRIELIDLRDDDVLRNLLDVSLNDCQINPVSLL